MSEYKEKRGPEGSPKFDFFLAGGIGSGTGDGDRIRDSGGGD